MFEVRRAHLSNRTAARRSTRRRGRAPRTPAARRAAAPTRRAPPSAWSPRVAVHSSTVVASISAQLPLLLSIYWSTAVVAEWSGVEWSRVQCRAHLNGAGGQVEARRDAQLPQQTLQQLVERQTLRTPADPVERRDVQRQRTRVTQRQFRAHAAPESCELLARHVEGALCRMRATSSIQIYS